MGGDDDDDDDDDDDTAMDGLREEAEAIWDGCEEGR